MAHAELVSTQPAEALNDPLRLDCTPHIQFQDQTRKRNYNANNYKGLPRDSNHINRCFTVYASSGLGIVSSEVERQTLVEVNTKYFTATQCSITTQILDTDTECKTLVNFHIEKK